ncbi:MAG: N-acetylmuramoyl-L-alanine amidase, partial [Treponema sp.]|nr:N-acetylmuramoyl-L-alanine amidase [Treponema sp.]
FFMLPAYVFAKDVNLSAEAEKEGMELHWDPLTRAGVLEKNGHYISFSAGNSFVLKDFVILVKEDAPYVEDNILMATSSFMKNAEDFFTGTDSISAYKIGAILIDPGHGGKDPGALKEWVFDGKKTTVQEKDITLTTGLLLRDYLRKAYPDKKILMTRSTDVYLKLEERTEIANSVKLDENEAILYVSIHVNASLDQNVSGYEAWYLSPDYRRQVLDKKVSDDEDVQSILNDMMEEEYTLESILISKFVLEGIGEQVGDLSKSRGMKANDWFVVKNSMMPSVLLEIGFLTNEAEAKLLNDGSYLKKVALGVYNGLQAFVSHFERSSGFTGAN